MDVKRISGENDSGAGLVVESPEEKGSFLDGLGKDVMILIQISYGMAAATNQPNLLVELRHVRDLLAGLLIVCGLVALASVAILQFAKPAARGFVQRRETQRWLKKRLDETGKAEKAVAGYPPRWIERLLHLNELEIPQQGFDNRELKRGPFSARPTIVTVPDEFYMRDIQNATAEVLEAPSHHVRLFLALSQGADLYHQAGILWLDLIGRHYPGLLRSLAEAQDRDSDPEMAKPAPARASSTAKRAKALAEAMAAASAAASADQEAVSAACERGHDELQLKLASGWTYGSRYLSLGVGLIVALAAAASVAALSPLTLLIGLAGGALASLLLEAGSKVGSDRRR